MQFVSKILYCVLLTSFASGLKQCNDCVKVTACEPALQRIRTDRSPETVALLSKAFCGYEGIQKVCCSDFFTSRSAIVNTNEEDKRENNPQTSGDEIENHRNINLLPTECGDLDGNRIVGGTSAGLYEFPWMALIAYRVGGVSKFQCGGTVISSRYVLTAAHCIVSKVVQSVRVGDYDISQAVDCTGDGAMRECESNYQDIAVTHTIHHRDYIRQPVVLNDIGLLRLARPVDFSVRNAGAICLPITKQLLEMELAGERGTVAGWGMTENQTRSNVLLKVELPIYSEATCNSFYNRNVQSRRQKIDRTRNTFCAGELGRDSCKGDSGGPLMLEGNYINTYKFVQFGVVSYGPSQCGSNTPGTYTDVRKFMKWILDTIKQ